MFSMTEQEAGTSEQTYGDFIGGHKNIQVRAVSVFQYYHFPVIGIMGEPLHHGGGKKS